jgi:pimeloyl-ACP methyl ester carboxylesterase
MRGRVHSIPPGRTPAARPRGPACGRPLIAGQDLCVRRDDLAPSPTDVELPDGRTLRILEAGDPGGRPVFVLHPTPGSKLLYAPHVADATRRGIRLIGHDRAGYGGSTAKPGRAVVDEASDVLAIADSLGIDRFALWGISTGGACALGCAGALPDRLVAVASLGAVAPYPSEGLDWFAGVAEANIADFQLFTNEPVAWRRKATREVREMREMTQEQFYESLFGASPEADRKVLTPELLAFAHAQLQDGLSPGPEGFIDDYLSGTRPWGFELSSIRVPVQLWHGMEDRLVPLAHAKWLAAHLPRAEIHLEPGEGHISLFTQKIAAVQEWLVSHF